jgi:hypothetical protein
MTPPGLFSSSSSSVCKLKQSLYGSLFLCKTPIGLVLLLVYVDDVVITGTNSNLIAPLLSRIFRLLFI